MFSKFLFKMGRYDNMTLDAQNSEQVKFYALKMALGSKRMSNEELYSDFIKKTSSKS